MATTCKECGAELIPGTLFCPACGAGVDVPTVKEHREVPGSPFAGGTTDTIQRVALPTREPVADQAPITPQTPWQLRILNTGRVIVPPQAGQWILGRKDPRLRLPEPPNVDLTEDGAYEAGVSRRHLLLFWRQGRLYAKDLGSTNGTWINRQPLPPESARPLGFGDEIRMGNLLLRIERREE